MSLPACINIRLFPKPFVLQYQQTTSAAWNRANQKSTIQAGDIVIASDGLHIVCAGGAKRMRGMLESAAPGGGSSEITVTSVILTPPGSSTSGATAAAALFQTSTAAQAYSSSQFASNFGISGVTTSIQPVAVQAFAAPGATSTPISSPVTTSPAAGLVLPAAPPDSSTDSATPRLSSAMVIGFEAGGGALVLGLIVLFAVVIIRKHRHRAQVAAVSSGPRDREANAGVSMVTPSRQQGSSPRRTAWEGKWVSS